MKAISYRRVSTKEQENNTSLQTQLEDIQRYSARNGFQLVADFSDDFSGSTLFRPGITNAMALLSDGAASVFIAYDSDRVSRNPKDYLHFREQLAEWGIELHYSQRGKVDLKSFGGKVIEDLQGRFAEEWRRKLLKLTSEGKREKAREGNVMIAKRPPYGYTSQDGRLVINEEEAETVRLIFKLYTQDNYSLSDIAQHLTTLRIPTHADIHPGMSYSKRWSKGYWSHPSVKVIIKNETYAGLWHFGKAKPEVYYQDGKRKIKHIALPKEQWIAVEVPAIIDRLTWEKAQTKLTTNKRDASRNTRHEFLLAKRLTCGICGLKLYSKYQRGEGYHYYYCASRHRSKFPEHQFCNLPYFNGNILDNDVWLAIKNKLENSEDLREVLEETTKRDKNKEDKLQRSLEQAEKQIVTHEKAIKKLILTFANDESDTDIKETLHELRAELNSLKQQKTDLLNEIQQTQNQLDETMEFIKVHQLMYTSLTLDSEPFQVKADWISGLDVKTTIRNDNGEWKADISCKWGDFSISIADTFSRKPIYNLPVSFTITLSQV